MKVKPVQKQTKAGQRTRFKAWVLIGDKSGHIGLGQKADKEVQGAIKGASQLARMAIIPVRMGWVSIFLQFREYFWRRVKDFISNFGEIYQLTFYPYNANPRKQFGQIPNFWIDTGEIRSVPHTPSQSRWPVRTVPWESDWSLPQEEPILSEPQFPRRSFTWLVSRIATLTPLDSPELEVISCSPSTTPSRTSTTSWPQISGEPRTSRSLLMRSSPALSLRPTNLNFAQVIFAN